MYQHIDIRVKATGQQIDVYPNETIEVNMGGISLLNLADRTVSYTNSFKLPRTPNNEALFAFASQPTRNNRPVIEVIITKGLFQKTATLKVKEFDGDYKCEISYSNVIDTIKNTTYERLLNAITLMTLTTSEDFIYNICSIGVSGFKYLQSESDKIPSDVGQNSLAINITDLLNLITTDTGITFDGDLFSDSDFDKSYLIVPKLYITDVGITNKNFRTNVVDSGRLISELLKEISYLFFSDVYYGDNSISINKVNTNIDGTQIETLTFDNKTINQEFANYNYINYSLNEDITDKWAYSDVYNIGGGVGEKDALTLKNYLCIGDSNLFNLKDDPKSANKIIIGTEIEFDTDTTISYRSATYSFVYGSDSLSKMSMFDLSGFYSSILNPIFANPVMLSASGYIDPLTADTIMNDRVINSVKLGGRYWVDEMKYNLTTGNSVLKLIKL